MCDIFMKLHHKPQVDRLRLNLNSMDSLTRSAATLKLVMTRRAAGGSQSAVAIFCNYC